MGLLLLTKEILDWTEISYLFSTLEDCIGKVEMQIVSRIFLFILQFEFLRIAEVVNDIIKGAKLQIWFIVNILMLLNHISKMVLLDNESILL